MKKQGSLKALLPLLVFLIVYIGTSAIAGDMYAVSVIIPFSAAAITALIMNKNKSLNEKLDIFCTGAGDNNVILMVLIFILAGAFAQVAKDMGAVDSTVNLGLSVLPSGLLVVGLFLIACFIALSVGTSVGTIVALVPIAVAVAEKTGVLLPIVVGAVVGGAMFGDNLSIISDTTIAATRTQGCDMKDKFKMNFRIVLPAAILTTIIFWAITLNSGTVVMEQLDFSLIKIIPYLVVIIAALCGMNVVVILLLGIILAGGIGLYYGAFDIISLCQSMANGISGMSELIVVTLLMAGTISLIKENGGIEFILHKGFKKFKNKRNAELGIGALVSFVDVCTANNTIAIVTVGPIAKDISDEFDLEPKRVAGIMDMFSCVFQGLIPYGAQLISAAGIAAISPFAIMKYLYYPYLMGICAIISIFWYHRKEAK
ncbi:Na+/H+ antiporter NhaC family protein [Clostridium sp. SM-530-WT-3G]|uniref:Na+/H+ antiporter NhaC family protein n=1 Tax=Clostridium sp. SM-530-WT-3G TaxID=2725303 RepID=UPI00145C8C7C|nr:Na+/H+ antiporter NhaC family protein [Clostridium sp. SM-530-WT-3G]NME81995.1 Na+/H+ antiporter NhaC family protein [Clostridium sp. SM-530-WT-3G]